MQIVNSYSARTRGVMMCAGVIPLMIYSIVGIFVKAAVTFRIPFNVG